MRGALPRLRQYLPRLHPLLALTVPTAPSCHIGVSFLVWAPAYTGRPPDRLILTKLVPASLPHTMLVTGHLRIHRATSF